MPLDADVGIAARDALIDGRERDVQKLGRPADAGGEQRGDLDVEADDADRDGTDRPSTNGAPPSGSPAQRRTRAALTAVVEPVSNR